MLCLDLTLCGPWLDLYPGRGKYQMPIGVALGLLHWLAEVSQGQQRNPSPSVVRVPREVLDPTFTGRPVTRRP